MPAGEKVAIVTGGNRGIGYAICEGLWEDGGFHTVLACRKVSDGEAAKEEICKGKGGGKITVMQLDLCNFESVRSFCSEFRKLGLPLHVMITNAGILRWKGWVASKDGFEEHLQANHLGHFLLVRELLPLLLKTPKSRVVSVGSELCLHASMKWDDLNNKAGFDAYMQSKLCNLLHIEELHSRQGAAPALLRAICIDPGEANTDIVRHFPMGWAIKIFLKFMPATLTSQRTCKEGADSAVFCATCDDATAAAFSGKFVRDRKLFAPAGGGTSLSPFSQIFLWALAKGHPGKDDRGAEARKRLWDLSDSIVDGKVKLGQYPDGGGKEVNRWALRAESALVALIPIVLILLIQYGMGALMKLSRGGNTM